MIDKGYSHIEVAPCGDTSKADGCLPPFTAFFSSNSPWPNPDSFKSFVNTCHQQGIGVLMRWNPERTGIEGEHLDYRNPTSFAPYISHVLFWFEHYHLDGVRLEFHTPEGPLRRAFEEKLVQVVQTYNPKAIIIP